MPTRYPPIDLEIASNLLPYTDLNIQGDPQRNLRIPNDIILTLSGLIGLSGGVPRMVSMQETGAINVSEAGGGTNDYSGSGVVTVGAGLNVNLVFGDLCTLWYICCPDTDFDITVLLPPGGNQSILRIFAGFQAFLPFTATKINVANQGAVAGRITLTGFFHNNALPQPAI